MSFAKHTPNLLSRKEYRKAQIRGWSFDLIVLTLLILFYYLWYYSNFNKYYIGILGVILSLIVYGDISEIKDSFKSYEQYEREWKEIHNKNSSK